MLKRARSLATEASFQAFANCYLREVDQGKWLGAREWVTSEGVHLDSRETHVVELRLAGTGPTLALGVQFRSLVGRHTLTAVHVRDDVAPVWRSLDRLSTVLLLIDWIYARARDDEHRVELISRVLESHRTMADYVAHALACPQFVFPGPASTFIDAEHSTVFGHWLHPTPKSRQGFLSWHHAHYAPEMGGKFQLHFFAVDSALVSQGSLVTRPADKITQDIAHAGPGPAAFEQILDNLSNPYCLLPLHPLQAQWLLHQDYVLRLMASGQIRDMGRMGAFFTPTSSVRTLYCEELDFMVKLSIPVKLTNSLRINLRSELGDSLWISKLCRHLRLSEEYPRLHILQDPAYITVDIPGMEQSGFEVIFRDNPFARDAQVHSIAALVQDPLTADRKSVLAGWVQRVATLMGTSLRVAARAWFDSYWECSIRAPIELYDRYGIALEAHQQNSLLSFDETGLPLLAYYRDIQGLSLLQGFRAELVACVPELALQPKLFEPDDVVQEGFGYYLFFNQLYSVVNRLALDGLIDEATLLEIIRTKLKALRIRMIGFGLGFIDAMLSVDAVGCKANLLTRVADVDELETENELGVYSRVPNPLHTTSRAEPPPVTHPEPTSASEPLGYLCKSYSISS